jgi:hypothetical protein
MSMTFGQIDDLADRIAALDRTAPGLRPVATSWMRISRSCAVLKSISSNQLKDFLLDGLDKKLAAVLSGAWARGGLGS